MEAWTNIPHKLSRNNGKEKYTTHFMRKRMKISRKLERKYHQFCIIDKESFFFLLATKIEKLEKGTGYKNGYIVKVADKLSYLLCNWSLNNSQKLDINFFLLLILLSFIDSSKFTPICPYLNPLILIHFNNNKCNVVFDGSCPCIRTSTIQHPI